MIGYSFDDNYGVKAVTGIDIKGDIIARGIRRRRSSTRTSPASC